MVNKATLAGSCAVQQKSSTTKTTSLHQKREPGFVCKGSNNFREQRGSEAAFSAMNTSGRGGREFGFVFYERDEGRKIR